MDGGVTQAEICAENDKTMRFLRLRNERSGNMIEWKTRAGASGRE